MAGVIYSSLMKAKQGDKDDGGDIGIEDHPHPPPPQPQPSSSTATDLADLRKQERRLMARRRLDEDRRQIDAELLQQDPFFVIPELVMRDVLVKLVNRAKDKFNFSQASRSAAEALEETKEQWLFHKIFSVPHLLPFLAKTDILCIRQVDQDCNEVLDLWVGEVTAKNSLILPPILCHQSRQHKTINDATALYPSLAYEPERLRTLVQQLQSGMFSSPSPFISRRASFAVYPWRGRPTMSYVSEQVYWQDVLTLLDEYGRELRSVSISIYSRNFTLIEMLQTVQKCLRRMPNLTELKCFVRSVYAKETDDSRFRRCPRMPPLPNLTRLNAVIWEPVRMQSRIFSCYYSQLVSLDASSTKSFLELYDPQSHSTFPNLKYLSVEVNSGGDGTSVFKLMSFTGPLQQVSIKNRLDTPLCLSVLFHIMEPFRETISALKLKQWFECTINVKYCDHSTMQMPPFKTLGAYELPEAASFDLPHLKTLVVNSPDCGYGSLDPLLKVRGSPIQQLEIIVAACKSKATYKAYQKERGDKLEVFGFEEKMYSSNIWELMSELQKLNFIKGNPRWDKAPDVDCYSREGYALFQAQRKAEVE